MTAVSMVVITTILGAHNGSLEQALPYILGVFLLSGLFQIAFGVLGVGKYIKYIPYPVVSRFMTAIGVIILITQILPVLGYDVKNDTEYIEQFKPLSGPLFFGFTSEFVNISKQIPKTASILIIRMDKVPFIDQSGLFALEDVLLDLYQKKMKF